MNSIDNSLAGCSEPGKDYSSGEGLEQLLHCVRERDITAFKALRQATTSMMMGVASRILRNQADVEDVVGEVFIKVWFQANRFDPARGSARCWLATLCRNASIDWTRRAAVLGLRVSLDSEHELECERSSSPDFLIEKFQLDTAVVQALSRLPMLQRQMVELAFYAELSHREISAAAGLPLGTVKSHLRRSLKRLHRDLDPQTSRRNRVISAALFPMSRVKSRA